MRTSCVLGNYMFMMRHNRWWVCSLLQSVYITIVAQSSIFRHIHYDSALTPASILPDIAYKISAAISGLTMRITLSLFFECDKKSASPYQTIWRSTMTKPHDVAYFQERRFPDFARLAQGSSFERYFHYIQDFVQ